MVIGISGYIGSGKDETGKIIQYLTTNKKDISYSGTYNSFLMDVGMGFEPEWKIRKFASKLKEIASILTGIPIYKFEDQEFKKTLLGDEWNYIPEDFEDVLLWGNEKKPMTVREFLQKLGTEAIRNGLHPQAWVNATFADYKAILDNSDGVPRDKYPNWIITDCRFPNEAQAIRERNGIVVRINRDVNGTLVRKENGALVSVIGGHPSEISLDDYTFDYVIDNNDNIENLIKEVEKMLKHFNII